MQDREKISEIRELLQQMAENNQSYADPKIGTYYDYDHVLSLLCDAADTMTATARNPRPKALPSNIPWSEKFADPDKDFDPYSYDGSMSPGDYDTMRAHFQADRKKGLIDVPGQPADGDTKIRFYDLHGKYGSKTPPFPEVNLPFQMNAAMKIVDRNPVLAGWEAYSFDRLLHTWSPFCQDGVNKVYYDTGKRAGGINKELQHVPPELRISPLMP